MTAHKTPRIPIEGTLRKAVHEFFDANPHEQLTVKDVAVKFDASEENASRVLLAMSKSGELKAEKTYQRRS